MRARWLLSLAVLTACVRPAGRRSEPPGMPALSRQTAAACDTIARLVEPTPGAEITRTQGTFDDPSGEHVLAGCRVLIAGSFTALTDRQGTGITSPIAPWVAPPSPDEVLRGALPAEGWTHEP